METKMTSTQQFTIETVFRRFQDFDNNAKWTKLDDYMSYLEWLEDAQLAREADFIFEKHRFGNPRCPNSHPKEQCLVPLIIDAVDTILELYKDSGSLEPHHKYVLQYYVTLTANGDIIA